VKPQPHLRLTYKTKPDQPLALSCRVGIGQLEAFRTKPWHNCLAIWDMGASNTSITQDVVDALQLSHHTFVRVDTALGSAMAPQYLVSILLPNGYQIKSLAVTLGKMVAPLQVLIGMDVIAKGDFSLVRGKETCDLHFTCPSLGLDNHHKEVKRLRALDAPDKPKVAPFTPNQSRNSPCKCGSGEIYKRCCEEKHRAEQAEAWKAAQPQVPPAEEAEPVPAAGA